MSEYWQNQQVFEEVTADAQRNALAALPPVKPGEPPNRARESTEEMLAKYTRLATAGQ